MAYPFDLATTERRWEIDLDDARHSLHLAPGEQAEPPDIGFRGVDLTDPGNTLQGSLTRWEAARASI